MNPITLTLAQARELQREPDKLTFGKWAFLLDVKLPKEPNITYNQERVAAGVEMLRLGCEVVQIMEQLLWRDEAETARTLERTRKRLDKKEADFLAEVAKRYGQVAVDK